MKKLVVAFVMIFTTLAQGEQEIESFCGFKLGIPITQALGQKIVGDNMGLKPWCVTFLDKPFRGFSKVRLDWSRKNFYIHTITVEKVLVVSNESSFATSHSDRRAVTRQPQFPRVVYTKDELNREVNTLIKMVEKKFGEPLKKSYEGNITPEKDDQFPASCPGTPNNTNAKLLQQHEPMFGRTRPFPPRELRKIILHYSNAAIVVGYDEDPGMRAKVTISCVIAEKYQKESADNTDENELKKRVDKFSQEEIDAL